MEHYFELPVNHNGEERIYKGRLVTFGYVYKFYIVVDKQELVFEKDDEGHYRALVAEGKDSKAIDPALIQAIVRTLEKLSDK